MNILTNWEIQKIKNTVHYENESRKVLNIEAKRISEILKQFEKEQILKKDGSLLKKIKDLIKFQEYKITPITSEGTATINLFLECNTYSIILNATLCFNGGSYDDKTYYCDYYKGYKYIAEIGNLSIKRFYDIKEMSQIDITEELKKCEDIKNLKKQILRTLKNN